MGFKLRLIKGTRSIETDLAKKIDELSKKSKKNVDTLANQAARYMRNYISSHARRDGHTGNLENNITVVRPKTGSKAAVYVGDVNKLNANAPYWYVLNYGATITGKQFIPPRAYGYFGEGNPPAGHFGTEQFNLYTGGGRKFYLMVPETFTPINYIEATNKWLKKNFRKTFSKKKI